MQQKQIVLTCATSLFLVLTSASYAADTPAEATANPTPEAASNPPQVAAEPPADTRVSSMPAEQKAPAEKTAMAAPMAPPVVSDPGKVYLIRENPFFSLHIDKAIQHARDAEIAGNRGQTAELLEHAKMSLMRAREAQRAGNVGGLNEGIANLRQALRLPIVSTQAPTQPSPSVAKDLDPQDQQQRELAAEPRGANAVNEATAFVREARKNFSQAAGTKYVEIKPQPMVAVSDEK